MSFFQVFSEDFSRTLETGKYKYLKPSNFIVAATNDYIGFSQTNREITVFNLNDEAFEKTITLKNIENMSETISTVLLGFKFTPCGTELIGLILERANTRFEARSIFNEYSNSPNRYRLAVWEAMNWNCSRVIEEEYTDFHFKKNHLTMDEKCEINIINTPSGQEVIWPAFRGEYIAFWNIHNQNLRFSSKKVSKCDQQGTCKDNYTVVGSRSS